MIPKAFSLPQFTLRAFATVTLIGVPYGMVLQGSAVPQELFTVAWVAAGSALGLDVARALGVNITMRTPSERRDV